MTENAWWQHLRAELPKAQVHWRAQTITKSGDRAMALAYIDARDVMNRLDEAVGPENWQDEYSTAGGRTICRLSIRVGDEWVCKSDGAGDTAVEGEKGGISDAFKRAAVKWGVARYLYDLPCPWVPCESNNGKFRKFTDDPWNYVRDRKPAPAAPAAPAPKPAADDAIRVIDAEGEEQTFKRTKRGALDAMQFIEDEIDRVQQIEDQATLWQHNRATFQKLADTAGVGDLRKAEGAQTLEERVRTNDQAFREYLEAA